MDKIQVTSIGPRLRKVCRLCLKSNVIMRDIFSFKTTSHIIEMITKCTSVKVSRYDGISNFICRMCYVQLIKTYNFRRQALKSDKTLRNCLQRLRVGDKKTEPEKSFQRFSENASDRDIKKNIDVLELNIKEEITSINVAPENFVEILGSIKQEVDPDQNSSCVETVSLCPVQPENIETFKINIKEEESEDLEIFRDNSKSALTSNVCSNNDFETDVKLEASHSIFFATDNIFKLEQNEDGILNEMNLDTGNLFGYNGSYKDTSKIHVKNFKDSSTPEHLTNKPIPTVEQPHKCEFCNKPFSRLCDLTTHKRKHTGEKPYQCDVCNKSYPYLVSLRKHSLLHTGEKPYQCDVCDKHFREAGNLKKHKLIHTGDKPFQCDVCNKTYSRSNDMKRHKLVHTGYSQLSDLKNTTVTDACEEPYQCDVCYKFFSQMETLNKHKLQHTRDKPFPCEVCEKCFPDMKTLKKHNLLHAGKKLYQCDRCDKNFVTSNNLAFHKLNHTGEKPLQCNVCSKRFTRPYDLKRHKLLHTNDKPYTCDICNKGFIQLASLKYHKVIHTGEKPYQCDVCYKSFTVEPYLKKHKLLHIV